ncbi:hypothetical protein NBH15_25610 [Parabacteroides sp. W1-Q-101]|uniref:hypothetical protein n=1 Tax=Parabacteroides caeci TaxID=2949650 RepID=UPI00202E37D4|nr:hypothetical protein [Parabacteroides sp. W1-Q-101]MCM0721634.1 hypothetical protein [Parabacteroides sp. W1-Q-101]
MGLVLSVIQTTLVSSVAAILVSEFLRLYRDKVLYKMEIQKELIKKRIEAYDQLEHIIAGLSIVARDEDGRRYHCIFVRKVLCETFMKDVGTALKYNLWYSNEIIDLLTEMNGVINLIVEPGYGFEETPEFYERKELQGMSMYEPIRAIKERLIAQMGFDLREMHRLDFKGLFPKR